MLRPPRLTDPPTWLNERKHYYWRSRTQPVVPTIVKHRRRYRYNVDGFRAVRYDVQMDGYFVLIYTGSDWRRGCEWRGTTKHPASPLARAVTSGSPIELPR
ncbi:hypothetical protein ACVWY2_008744 [Bradyrhizobium sp. JR6.1]